MRNPDVARQPHLRLMCSGCPTLELSGRVAVHLDEWLGALPRHGERNVCHQTVKDDPKRDASKECKKVERRTLVEWMRRRAHVAQGCETLQKRVLPKQPTCQRREPIRISDKRQSNEHGGCQNADCDRQHDAFDHEFENLTLELSGSEAVRLERTARNARLAELATDAPRIQRSRPRIAQSSYRTRRQ